MSQINRALAIWSWLFGALFACWTLDEATQPGQQYADPLWPCAYVAFLAACPTWLIVEQVRYGTIGRWLDR